MRWSDIRRRLLVGCIIAVLVYSISQSFASSTKSNKPQLVVLIAIDAFRFDYLTRFEQYFSDGGFKLLLNQGANFTNAHINHFRTSTAPGHTTMLTGAYGYTAGVIDNEWWDRNLHKKFNCVEDSNSFLIPVKNHVRREGRSPKNLLVTTVGDELRLSNNFKSKVIGISYKDRAAILTSGKLANAAYWFDDSSGDFISSSYYMKELLQWVQEFNYRKLPDRYFGRKWEKILDEEAYTLAREDDFPHELDYKGMGIVFPHTINGNQDKSGIDFYKAFAQSPFADEHLSTFANALIENEKLGEDEVTDILTISFTATDRIGHQFGPYSTEMQDQVLRIDRVLETFFSYLDVKIGLRNIAILLTADHGSGPIPEYMARFKVDAGRVDSETIPEGEDSIIIPTTVDSALDQKYGSANWVEAFIKPNVYLNYEAINHKNLNLSKVERVAAKALTQIKGIAGVFTRTQLLAGRFPDNEMSQRVSNQFYPERSGDLIIYNKPYYTISAYKNSVNKGADHETGYDYDTHIPLIFYGKQFKSGTYSFPVILNDLAPTLSYILGISFPSGNEGRVLYEALN
ncbi:MAG: alkaline phosphatase family protein [bacterium]